MISITKLTGYIRIRKIKKLIESKIRDSMDQLKENAGNLGYPRTAEGVGKLVKEVTHDPEDYGNLMVDDYLISSYLDTARMLGLKMNPELEKEAVSFTNIFE
jgi:hypothetical protein